MTVCYASNLIMIYTACQNGDRVYYQPSYITIMYVHDYTYHDLIMASWFTDRLIPFLV